MNDFILLKEDRARKIKNPGIFRVSAMIIFLMTFIFWVYPVYSEDILERAFQLSPLLKTKVPITSVEVKNAYPHDPNAFTQGLFFHQGYFYESTGLNGKSTLSRKEVKTGKSLQEVKISQEYFGEGIALFANKIFQLTWQNQTVLIYDARSFKEIRQMKYRGEGWGLTSDGKHLLMSNGS